MDFYDLLNQHNVFIYIAAAWFMVFTSTIGDIFVSKRRPVWFDFWLTLFLLYFAGGVAAVFDTSVYVSMLIGIASYPLLRIILENREKFAERIAAMLMRIEIKMGNGKNDGSK